MYYIFEQFLYILANKCNNYLGFIWFILEKSGGGGQNGGVGHRGEERGHGWD